MPNKAIAGWTQVPVVAADLISIHYDRKTPTTNQVLVAYEIHDSLGAVRGQGRLAQDVGTYPVSVAAILSAINTAEGT